MRIAMSALLVVLAMVMRGVLGQAVGITGFCFTCTISGVLKHLLCVTHVSGGRGNPLPPGGPVPLPLGELVPLPPSKPRLLPPEGLLTAEGLLPPKGQVRLEAEGQVCLEAEEIPNLQADLSPCL